MRRLALALACWLRRLVLRILKQALGQKDENGEGKHGPKGQLDDLKFRIHGRG